MSNNKNSEYNTIINIIKNINNNSNNNLNKNKLSSYLKSKLRERGEYNLSSNVIIPQENLYNKCDIVIDNKIGIELITKFDSERLESKINRIINLSSEYDYLIIYCDFISEKDLDNWNKFSKEIFTQSENDNIYFNGNLKKEKNNLDKSELNNLLGLIVLNVFVLFYITIYLYIFYTIGLNLITIGLIIFLLVLLLIQYKYIIEKFN